MTTTAIRSCLVMAWATAASLVLSAPAAAQSTESSGNPSVSAVNQPSPDGEATSAQEEDSAAAAPPRIRSTGGREVVVSEEEFNRILQSLDKTEAPEKLPDFNVTEVKLTGEVDDGYAKLNAQIGVKINVEDRPVLVLLGLKEATLTEPETYEGDGDVIPGRSDEEGYRWWFVGRGVHSLSLKFLVPIRKSGSNRRLQLTVPESGVSTLKLTIPGKRVRVELPRESKSTLIARETTTSEGAAATAEVIGIGRLLDLQWQVLPDVENLPPAIQVNTEITARQTVESLLLEATQTILTRQGSVEALDVQLPPGFELIDVDGERYQSHRAHAEKPGYVTVQLTGPTTEREPIQLEWILEKTEFSPQGGTLSLEGFRLDGARRESGKIRVVALEGFRIARQDAENRFVFRSDVRTSNAASGQFTTAYEFRQQPFRLVVGLEEIQPRFTSEPDFRLHLSEDRAVLDGRFGIDVYRGAIQSVDLEWPARQSDGWSIDLVETPDLIEQVQMYETTESGSIRIHLVSRKTGRFELPLKASRELDAAEAGVTVTLPRVAGAIRGAATLSLTHAANTEVEVFPDDSTSFLELPAESAEPAARRFRFAPARKLQRLALSVRAHEQTIQSNAVIRIRMMQDRLQIEQRLQYNVAYEPLSPIRLSVPKQLGRVDFSFVDSGADGGESEKPLEPTWSESELDTLNHQAGLHPAVPAIGEFEVLARFEIALSGSLSADAAQEVSVPLIRPVGDDLLSARVEPAAREDRIALEVAGPDWSRHASEAGFSAWSTDAPGEHIPVMISRSSPDDSQQIAVHKALIRTRIQPDGTRCRTLFEISGPVETLSVMIPPEALDTQYLWDGDLIPEDRISADGGETGLVHLHLGDLNDNGLQRLWIDYRTRTGLGPRGSDRFELAAPRFVSVNWVEKTVWEVTLPPDRYLFTMPEAFTPEFDWQRETLFWQRKMRAAPANENFSFRLSGETFASEREGDGNTYRFSRFGPAGVMEFSCMSRAMIVFFGAGFTLLTGFVLKIVKPLRSFLTLLAVMFVLSVVGLWYAEPVKLLLQPALFGVVLAVAAASIEGYLKRRRRQPILTLSSPSDFLVPVAGSTEEHPPLFGAGSEEPIEAPGGHRPKGGPPAAGEPITSSDSGHRR